MKKKVTPDQAVIQLRKDLNDYLDRCVQAHRPFDHDLVEGYINLICDAACLAARAKQAK